MVKFVVKSVVNICGKNCGEIEKLLDWNKNWCGKIQQKTLSRQILEQGGQWPLQFYQWTRTEVSSCSCCCSCSSPKNLPNLHKSLQPTLESSSIQTTEPIVKFHTILEMGSHDESAHTFGSSLRYLEVPPKGV